MSKEFIRMQLLSGIITESEYVNKLNESPNTSLIINVYSPNKDSNALDGFIEVNSKKYYTNYIKKTFTPGEKDDRLTIWSYNKTYNTEFLSPEDINELEIYLKNLNISYKSSPNWGMITIYDVSLQNIEIKYGATKPKSNKNKIKFEVLEYFIKRDKPKMLYDFFDNSQYIEKGNIYDFGGAEGRDDEDEENTTVVVDIYLSPPQKKNSSKFIEADLSKFVKLPPRDTITISSSVAQINSPNNLSKTINHSLNPGGLLILKDHIGAIQDLLKYLKNLTLLELQYTDVEDENNLTLSDQIRVVLKK